MRKFILASCLGISMVSASGVADQLEGIVPFENNTPADADDVNNNNLILSNKAQDLDARVRQLEDVSMRLIREDSAARFSTPASNSANTETGVGGLRELDGGKLILDDINCTEDPHALNRAYIEHRRFKDITFYITGECYGDYTLRDPEDASLGFFQEFGQSVAIRGNVGADGSLPRPRIVPNPSSGRISLGASFGGGFYIYDVDIEHSGGGWAILFSRGSTGSIGSVSINCSPPEDESFNPGIMVQNGAIPYIVGNVLVEGCKQGLWVTTGSSVALYGSMTVENAETGLLAEKNSTVTRRFYYNSNITIRNAVDAMSISDSTVELGNSGAGGATNIGGNIRINSSSVSLLSTYRLETAGSIINLNNSDVSLSLIGPDGEPGLVESYLDDTALANRLICSGNSVVDLYNNADGTLIPISQCWDTNDWSQHINPAASTP